MDVVCHLTDSLGGAAAAGGATGEGAYLLQLDTPAAQRAFGVAASVLTTDYYGAWDAAAYEEQWGWQGESPARAAVNLFVLAACVDLTPDAARAAALSGLDFGTMARTSSVADFLAMYTDCVDGFAGKYVELARVSDVGSSPLVLRVVYSPPAADGGAAVSASSSAAAVFEPPELDAEGVTCTLEELPAATTAGAAAGGDGGGAVLGGRVLGTWTSANWSAAAADPSSAAGGVDAAGGGLELRPQQPYRVACYLDETATGLTISSGLRVLSSLAGEQARTSFFPLVLFPDGGGGSGGGGGDSGGPAGGPEPAMQGPPAVTAYASPPPSLPFYGGGQYGYGTLSYPPPPSPYYGAVPPPYPPPHDYASSAPPAQSPPWSRPAAHADEPPLSEQQQPSQPPLQQQPPSQPDQVSEQPSQQPPLEESPSPPPPPRRPAPHPPARRPPPSPRPPPLKRPPPPPSEPASQQPPDSGGFGNLPME